MDINERNRLVAFTKGVLLLLRQTRFGRTGTVKSDIHGLVAQVRCSRTITVQFGRTGTV